MNITAQALVFSVASVAIAAAVGTGLADFSAQSSPEIVKLERVVVVGKRSAEQTTQIAQLPRVIITGHRVSDAEVQQMASSQDSKVL